MGRWGGVTRVPGVCRGVSAGVRKRIRNFFVATLQDLMVGAVVVGPPCRQTTVAVAARLPTGVYLGLRRRSSRATSPCRQMVQNSLCARRRRVSQYVEVPESPISNLQSPISLPTLKERSRRIPTRCLCRVPPCRPPLSEMVDDGTGRVGEGSRRVQAPPCRRRLVPMCRCADE